MKSTVYESQMLQEFVKNTKTRWYLHCSLQTKTEYRGCDSGPKPLYSKEY